MPLSWIRRMLFTAAFTGAAREAMANIMILAVKVEFVGRDFELWCERTVIFVVKLEPRWTTLYKFLGLTWALFYQSRCVFLECSACRLNSVVPTSACFQVKLVFADMPNWLQKYSFLNLLLIYSLSQSLVDSYLRLVALDKLSGMTQLWWIIIQ